MQRASLQSRSVQKRLLPVLIYRLTDGTIGSRERLAGVGPDPVERVALWRPYASLAKDGNQIIDDVMAECYRRIAARIDWVDL